MQLNNNYYEINNKLNIFIKSEFYFSAFNNFLSHFNFSLTVLINPAFITISFILFGKFVKITIIYQFINTKNSM